MIVLPENEKILDFVCGDRDMWIVNGNLNIGYVKPAKEGSMTNLNLITANGNIYTFVLVEVSNLPNTEPDLKVFIQPKEQSMISAASQPPRYFSSEELDSCRQRYDFEKQEIKRVQQAAQEALAQAGLFKPGVIDFDVRDMTGAEQVERLAKIPLIHQPGTTWEYSLASDVVGRVVEAAAGKRLADFMSERLFKPLKMSDTAFWVAEAKLGRVAEPFDKDPLTGTAIKLISVSKEPGNDSGGAGALSTAGDYLRFAQMLGNGGVLNGQRVLSRTTVKLMTSDHLGTRLPLAPTLGGSVLGNSTYTFGLGFAVRPSDGIAPVPGSAGDFNWGGYAGTAFWVDPKEQLVAVFMVQSAGALRTYHRTLFRQLVYQAIID